MSTAYAKLAGVSFKDTVLGIKRLNDFKELQSNGQNNTQLDSSTETLFNLINQFYLIMLSISQFPSIETDNQIYLSRSIQIISSLDNLNSSDRAFRAYLNTYYFKIQFQNLISLLKEKLDTNDLSQNEISYLLKNQINRIGITLVNIFDDLSKINSTKKNKKWIVLKNETISNLHEVNNFLLTINPENLTLLKKLINFIES